MSNFQNKNNKTFSQQQIMPYNQDYGHCNNLLYDEMAESILCRALVYDVEICLLTMANVNIKHLYTPKCIAVFDAAKQLADSKKEINIMSICFQVQEMKQYSGIFPTPYDIVQYISEPMPHLSVSNVIQRVKELFIKRELVKMATMLAQKAVDVGSDVEELSAEVELIQKMINGEIQSEKSIVTMPEHVAHFDRKLGKLIEVVRAKNKGECPITGIDTGIEMLNSYTSGWQNGNLIILAARPGMGKSTLGFFFANVAAKKRYKVGIFSLEMSDNQVIIKLLVFQNDIDPTKLKHASLNNSDLQKYSDACGELQEMDILLDTNGGITMTYISNKCRVWKMKYGLDMVVVDYLQIIAPEVGGTKNDQITNISNRLKALAKEFNIPVIALAQINRSVEARENTSKRPQLSDLRDSGAIEQDADVVIFLRRLEYYGILEHEELGTTKNIIDIFIAKNREGETGDLYAVHDGKMARIFDPIHYNQNYNNDIAPF